VRGNTRLLADDLGVASQRGVQQLQRLALAWAAATLEAIEELLPWNLKPVLDDLKLDKLIRYTV